MNRVDRLFGILLRLQRRGRVRAQDLARHFEVSERTIYRDIAALNELGVPIVSLPNAGYELPASFSLPPLFFTTGEARALALAAQLMLAQSTGATSQDAERAFTKIAAILPAELRRQVDELSAVVRFYAAERPFELDDPRLTQLRRAIAERRVVALRYHSYRGDETLDREVEPDGLTYHHGAWYLGGYCRLRRGHRSFRLDRIEALQVREATFEPRTAERQAPPLTLVRVRFDPAVLRWVRERQHFGYVDDEAGDVLRYEVADPGEMVPWLLGWGARAEVLEPEALRSRVREEARRLLAILT
jgi:predicted DNA-binding transcriptional regulator YafY